MRLQRKIFLTVCASILLIVRFLSGITSNETNWSEVYFGFPLNSSRVWKSGRTINGVMFSIGFVGNFQRYIFSKVLILGPK